MGKERETLEFVYSQVSYEVGKMYARYKEKYGLVEETEPEKQLEILISKKYISKSFHMDLILLADYYLKEMYVPYSFGLENYKMRIYFLLEEV